MAHIQISNSCVNGKNGAYHGLPILITVDLNICKTNQKNLKTWVSCLLTLFFIPILDFPGQI